MRASSIKDELEELLNLGEASGDENEAVLDPDNHANSKANKTISDDARQMRRNKSTRRIRYAKDRPDHGDAKSIRSNQSARSSRSSKSARSEDSRSSSLSKGMVVSSDDDLVVEKGSGRSSKPSSRSSQQKGGNRSSAIDRRKIRYRSDESGPETAEERDSDLKSTRSKGSAVSRNFRRSAAQHRKTHNRSRSSERFTIDRLEALKDDAGHEKKARGTQSRPSRMSHRKPELASDTATDQDEKKSNDKANAFPPSRSSSVGSSIDDWSSGDEEDIHVGLNDEEPEPLNDEKPKMPTRTIRRYTSIRDHTKLPERRMRSAAGSRRSNSLERFQNNSGNSDAPSTLRPAAAARRSARRTASNTGNLLGDPSRRAPPGRSKSNDIIQQPAAAQADRRAPPRSQSNDFYDFLRDKGLPSKPDWTTASNNSNSNDVQDTEEEGKDDCNPFEVTFKNTKAPDMWDPFPSERDLAEEPIPTTTDSIERRGNLRATRSCAFLQASSKDTIKRGKPKIGMASNNKHDFSDKKEKLAGAHTENEPSDAAKSQREKQRRADYRKSIAAATMAGRRHHTAGGDTGGRQRLPSTAARPQRQSRMVHTSIEESMNKLEGALNEPGKVS